MDPLKCKCFCISMAYQILYLPSGARVITVAGGVTRLTFTTGLSVVCAGCHAQGYDPAIAGSCQLVPLAICHILAHLDPGDGGPCTTKAKAGLATLQLNSHKV